VLDFGIARVLERRESAAETLAGRRFGTPGYMAPEQALGRAGDIDGQSDLWGTAATMYTLLSGQLVHEAETVEEVLIRAGTEPARPVRSIVPDLAPPVAEAIDRALAFDKQDRWPDAAAMREALAGAVTASLGETLPIDLLRRVHPVRSTPPRRVRRRRSGAILFPLAVAAIVAGATVAMPKTHATWSSWTAGWKQALVTHSPARALSRHR
jgi:serine/threonine-protein kinase